MIMQPHPLCEPIALPFNRPILVDRVIIARGDPTPAIDVHFHDACEIVLFERAQGTVHVDGQTLKLTNRCLVCIPSVAVHDFVLNEGPKAWTLVQIAPFLVAAAHEARGAIAPDRPRCVALAPAAWERARILCAWLAEAAQPSTSDTAVLAMLQLLFDLFQANPDTAGTDANGGEREQPLNVFGPALARLHDQPGKPFSLAEAASRCGLSQAYFSRRFRQITGRAFSDYVASYRLQIGSHFLLSTARPISSIAYDSGFSSPSHFTARFREQFGLTPREYRRLGAVAASRRSPAGAGHSADRTGSTGDSLDPAQGAN